MFTNIKNSFNNNFKFTFLALLLVLVLAAFLRLYKLDEVPPSLSWDEAANGYNAFTIANWGKDEWGRTLPLYFKSFEDDKNPVHIYLTAIPVRLLGLSEFSTRLAPAILGIFNVLLIFLLARQIFASKLVGVIAAIIMAVSPYALQFSRFNHETTFALFFFMLGLWAFFKGVKEKAKFLPLAFLSFGVDLLTYHSVKAVVPPIIILLVILYWKNLWKVKQSFIAGVIILGVFGSLFFFNPALLGTARMKQSSVPEEVIRNTQLFRQTQNLLLGRLELAGQRYLTYFSYDFLFKTGDSIARHSTGAVGEFYKLDLPFLIVGLLGLIWMRSKAALILLVWAALAPFPASASGGITETGHAGRALFMMGSWHLITAWGYVTALRILKKFPLQLLAAVVLLVILGREVSPYLNYYYGEYPKRYAIEWQYGMKQIVQYLQDKNGYFQVYTTDARSQPYIFFLYYLQTPLPQFLGSVHYNDSQSRPSNLVDFYDKYFFGSWEPVESMPNPGVLYVLTPSQYDGLRYRNVFDVKKLVKYPNGLDAYFLVSYP